MTKGQMPKEVQITKPIKPLFCPMPNVREVRKELERVIKMFLESYREIDGRVHDERALWTLGCLKRALELLPTKGGR
jgi:hypothetical protein